MWVNLIGRILYYEYICISSSLVLTVKTKLKIVYKDII